MSKCEFNKDALQHICGTATGKAIFKQRWLVNVSIFYSQFKFVHRLAVSLTTDTLSKAIMDLSSVQRFSNIVSLTEGGMGSAGGTLLVFQVLQMLR